MYCDDKKRERQKRGLFFGVGEGEEVAEGTGSHLAPHEGNGFCQGDVFGADAEAILCIAALGNATALHERTEALRGLHGTGGVGIEEAHLGKRCRAHKL